MPKEKEYDETDVTEKCQRKHKAIMEYLQTEFLAGSPALTPILAGDIDGYKKEALTRKEIKLLCNYLYWEMLYLNGFVTKKRFNTFEEQFIDRWFDLRHNRVA